VEKDIIYAKIREKNRITLPKKIIDLFEFKVNDDIVFIIENDKVILGKIKQEIISRIKQ
jgi:bifunctional DNA-binding transcriptional regulator/antitoxin component of YhaV-PrlF toxin-antitoxin module